MSNIELPAVELIQKKGKNYIYQLQKESTLANVYKQEPLVLKDNDGNKILVTRKGNKIDQAFKYVLTTMKKPELERIISGEQKLKWEKHPKLKKRFNKASVSSSWANAFDFIEETDQINGLRSPQIGAIYSVLSHTRVSDEIATVVMPTGTGKTETMMSLLVYERYEILLITVPTDALRTQISEKFSNLGILKKFGIVKHSAKYPIVGVIKSRFTEDRELEEMFSKCNVIITTMSLLTGSMVDMQPKIAELCSKCFIDEAHHVKANTWDSFAQQFDKRKLVQFTATPFRNDGKRMDGKIVFNYPLKKAQEEGYFKKINFHPIHEYNQQIADVELAKKGVSILEEDLKNGKNHILMARCRIVKRAKEVLKIYQSFNKYNPVIIYGSMGAQDRENAKNALFNSDSRIVVCVDMLGEGFDLPNLKIAIFHDIRQSLPITLQLAGRFTRTKYDEELGEASFVANLADLSVKEELEELYSHGSDWNLLLAEKSTDQIESEINFSDFMSGFSNSLNEIPLQNIRPSLSTVVYHNKNSGWNYGDFRKALGLKKDDVIYSDVNEDEKIIVLVTGRKLNVDWGNIKAIQDITWGLIIVYFDKELGLLFINSNDNSSLYSKLASQIIGEEARIINRLDVFKAFHNIKRTMLKNIGLKEYLGRNIRFRMSVGDDIEEALSIEEKRRGQKAFVYGVGYEDGIKVSLGCSYKGRIWSRLNGDLMSLTTWCKNIGRKLINPEIDGNQILKETLIPQYISEIPDKQACYIDWDEEIYKCSETEIEFVHGRIEKHIFEVDLQLELCQGRIVFNLIMNDDLVIPFEMSLYEKEGISDYSIKMIDKKYIGGTVKVKSKKYSLIEFFNKYVPTIWYVDGSSLSGIEYVELKQIILPYDSERIIDWDWSGVDLSKESQKVSPKIKDSIQYKVINELKNGDYDIIYDDDGKGEIADIVTIKQNDEVIDIELYHLKFAKKGKVNKRVDNLYEVCGQSQKSIHWKHKDAKEFFDHLLRRKFKNHKGNICSRIELGTVEKLIELSQVVKKRYPVRYKQYIVQPGLSKSDASVEQLTLLGVTETYLKEYGAMDLTIIASK